MKTKSVIILSALTIGCLLSFTGCKLEHKQVITKSTVFGFQATTPSIGSSGAVSVQIGLIRSEYISNPTATNTVYAAPLQTHVTASLNPLTQSANEDISTR